ncbi:MAG: hydrogenase formation protein HypD [Bacteroidales bacterium]|nr:hydrogenase formation protein HypD [Bacteroidales bacterium]
MELFSHNHLRNREAIRKLADEIQSVSKKPVRLMEVCGGHSMAIYRFGIKSLLPATIELLSGPGCPVCVSSQQYLDGCLELSRQKDVMIATYGDLIRVPGSSSSLERERSRGADIHIVYSVTEAISLARKNPEKKVVFLGIGFETTAPASAYAVLQARNQGLQNFFLFSAHKVMPPALRALVDEHLKIDGFIAPGHVSSITGTEIYRFLSEQYGKGVVVSGFEPLDLMQSILLLVRQAERAEPAVENQYKRVVRPEGNRKALGLLDTVFELADDHWRGLGIIPLSGLQLRDEYSRWDARKHFELPASAWKEPAGCICGEILKGLKTPKECPLFDRTCTPANPIGACMVSSEGSCAIVYKYNRN